MEIATPEHHCHSSSVVADLGSEVVVDLPLGKLVCNLWAYKNERSLEWARECRLTSNGTSALIINWTVRERLVLLEKLTRYFKLKVRDTA